MPVDNKNEVMQLSPSTQAGFEACGNAFADSELTASESLLSHAKLLGDKPSFILWEAGRLAWCKGYADNKQLGINDDATYKAWSRFAKRLENDYGMTKPKKTDNVDSVKKAESRGKAKTIVEDLKAKTYEELQSEIDMLLAKPTLDNVNKSKPFLKAIEEKRKEGLKDRMDSIKTIQNEITGLVKKCFDEVQLQAIHAILNGYDYEVAGI